MNVTANWPRKLTIAEFLAFYETRPDEEQWQLVDGAALLMTPPFPIHQRIASNLERLLNDALDVHAPQLVAFQRIGIELAAFPHHRPEPDVAVVDADILPGQRHFERFYLVAEVLSDSDEDRVQLKRRYYRAHEANRAILLIRQDIQQIELDSFDGSRWATVLLSGPDATLRLPSFGLSCTLDAIYRKTVLAAH